MNSEKTTARCYGKPIPKTYDALYFLGHYKDPRSISAGIKPLLSGAVIAGAIIIQFLLFFG